MISSDYIPFAIALAGAASGACVAVATLSRSATRKNPRAWRFALFIAVAGLAAVLIALDHAGALAAAIDVDFIEGLLILLAGFKSRAAFYEAFRARRRDARGVSARRGQEWAALRGTTMLRHDVGGYVRTVLHHEALGVVLRRINDIARAEVLHPDRRRDAILELGPDLAAARAPLLRLIIAAHPDGAGALVE